MQTSLLPGFMEQCLNCVFYFEISTMLFVLINDCIFSSSYAEKMRKYSICVLVKRFIVFSQSIDHDVPFDEWSYYLIVDEKAHHWSNWISLSTMETRFSFQVSGKSGHRKDRTFRGLYSSGTLQQFPKSADFFPSRDVACWRVPKKVTPWLWSRIIVLPSHRARLITCPCSWTEFNRLHIGLPHWNHCLTVILPNVCSTNAARPYSIDWAFTSIGQAAGPDGLSVRSFCQNFSKFSQGFQTEANAGS
jgi:hypothetical protein